MIDPFAAGGSFDVIARILAARMSEILSEQVIVENASGAAGIIGVNRVVNAAPDGYTFLFGSIGTHAYNQTIYKKPRYDAIADFTPVALFAEQPMVLTARKDFPADNLPQFIDYVKKNSAKLQFGSWSRYYDTPWLRAAQCSYWRKSHARSLSRRRTGRE